MVKVQSATPTAGVLLFAFGLLAGGAQAGTEESLEPASGGLCVAAEARVAQSDLRRAVSPQTTQPSAEPSPRKPFFKTGRGIAAVIMMVGGLGWLVYSHSHDRVKSPGNTGF